MRKIEVVSCLKKVEFFHFGKVEVVFHPMKSGMSTSRFAVPYYKMSIIDTEDVKMVG